MTRWLPHELEGQTVLLHPDRALFWREAGVLVVVDTHFGKPQIFREKGIPLPGGTTGRDLGRLTDLVAAFEPNHLIFLGDLMHGPLAARAPLEGRIARWRRQHPRVRLHLVTGNHDLRAGDPPRAFRFHQVVTELVWKPFRFTHRPAEGRGAYGIAGHLHPAVTLTGKGRQRETLPCFWFGRQGAVLPAFGSFTGSRPVRPRRGDGVYGIAGDEVLALQAGPSP